MMRNKYVNALFFIALIAILLVINTTNAKDAIRTTALDISEGFLSTANFLFFNFSSGITKLKESVDVYKEREHLRLENSRLKTQLIKFEEMSRENERLRSLLNFEGQIDFGGISAQVIGRDMSPFSDFIIINRGKKDNIDIGTVLMSHEGLVGHVVSAGENHARAILLSDNKARVSAIIQDTREAGILEGTPMSLLKLKRLDITSSVKVGDVVITSGFGDIYPKGIPIGRVEQIGNESNNLSLYALVRPFVEFAKLEEVLCLRKE
ncbi:MAG: rod shape-determining protein MreC [Candidatus Omnitrophica bacterium]|nr:rod shape-determining protein MreC [Candidatus Omnitrophota bacterium]